MMVDAGYDFAFLRIRVRGDGEVQAFDWSADRFGGWRMREWNCGWIDESGGRGSELSLSVGEMGRNRGWVHKRDGGGTELGLGRDDLDVVTEDGSVGHVGLV